MTDANDVIDESERAFAAITARLQDFVSPTLQNAPASLSQYQDDPYRMDTMEWYQDELREEPLMTGSPKRTPLLQRADTPVMSNSSSKNQRKTTEGSFTHEPADENAVFMEEEDVVMEPVQTPMQRTFKPTGGASRTPPGSSTKTTYPKSSALNQNTFRRYHDALLGYLEAKQRLSLEQEEHQLTGGNALVPALGGASSSSVALAEQHEEENFCKALSQIGYSLSVHDSVCMEDGHFWCLLAMLRKIGLSALMWHDDSTSLTQNDSTQAFFLQQLAAKVESTPKEILEALKPSSQRQPPLALKRKFQLMSWIQCCLDQEESNFKSSLSRSVISAAPSRTHPDDPSIPSLVSETGASNVKLLMRACLNEIMEGKIVDACELAKAHGFTVKSCLWVGGEADGYKTIVDDRAQKVDKIAVGNPHRWLWKRRMSEAGRRLLQDKQQAFGSVSATTEEEAAIYSVLANDVTTALANPCLRNSWTKSLCVLLTGVWCRVEDEVLYRHNCNRRRSCRPAFPGCQYEKEENECLSETSQLAGMREAQIASTLQSNVFLQKKQHDEGSHRFPYRTAMMAFIIGRSAILDFCAEEVTKLVSDIKQSSINGQDDQDWKALRFVTHLLCFLESFQTSSTSIIIADITNQKNLVLFEYVKYLESRPDLWHFLTLYVSLLPDSTILEYLPSVLCKVLDTSERKLMMEQIRNLMLRLELPLLRRVVRLALSTEGLGYVGNESLDAVKCNSLEWLLQYEEHFGDALICTNILLRDFLLNEDEDKMDVAMDLINHILPEDFVDRAVQTLPEDMEQDHVSRVNDAHSEYLAYKKYLNAYGSFQIWKEVLKGTPTLVDRSEFVDTSTLNAIEGGIADQAVRRTWLKEKKQCFEKCLTAAISARGALHKVLTHPGGWLCTDDDEGISSHPGDDEELTRRAEMNKIRSRHLVLAVNLYHLVCSETASWISQSLDDTGSVGLSRDDLLSYLNGDASNTEMFWYEQCDELLPLVASDTFGIFRAFSPLDLKDLLSKIGETAVAELMNG